jgi:hypothetical protein
MDWAHVLDGLLVLLLGAAVGVGELVSRYRDAPGAALKTSPALLYIVINAASALAALALMRAFDWTLGVTGAEALRWTQVLVAGFGSMAVFRTSLFTVRVADQDIGVGPVSFLQVILGAADRAVDRIRAQDRSDAVSEAMQGISFDKAYEALPAYAFALMQNLPDEDQELFARQLALIDKAEMENAIKTRMLGLALLNLVGEDVLRAAVDSLR